MKRLAGKQLASVTRRDKAMGDENSGLGDCRRYIGDQISVNAHAIPFAADRIGSRQNVGANRRPAGDCAQVTFIF
jgi:hypothetical protein